MSGALAIDVAADAHDLAGVRTLVPEHIDYERSDVVTPDDRERTTSHHVAVGNVVIFVARIDGLATGYASMTSDVATWAGERFGHLDCPYVDEARRGAGLGRLLLNTVVSDARALELHMPERILRRSTAVEYHGMRCLELPRVPVRSILDRSRLIGVFAADGYSQSSGSRLSLSWWHPSRCSF